VLRATQLGLCPEQDISDAIYAAKFGQMEGIKLTPERITELHAKVCEQLPKFASAQPEEKPEAEVEP
jgi:hypothetical protein